MIDCIEVSCSVFLALAFGSVALSMAYTHMLTPLLLPQVQDSLLGCAVPLEREAHHFRRRRPGVYQRALAPKLSCFCAKVISDF